MLSEISIEESDRWDRIVRSFQEHDVYYFSGYTKAFQLHGDGEPVLFYFEADGRRAINAVMKRDISHHSGFSGVIDPHKYYDLITPYGYGGFLLEGEFNEDEINRFNAEYMNYCIENRIVSEYVRFHPILNNKNRLMGMYDTGDIGKTISIDLSSQDLIWQNLSSKNRNMIRKARKSDIRIFWGRSPELLEDFISMYRSTMEKNNADEYYYFRKSFFESILYDLKYSSMIFSAVYQGQIIAMAMILYGNRRMHYHLSASDPAYRHLAPANLLLYEAACWGSENQYKTFHLGGGLHSREDRLYHFKRAFYTGSAAVYSVGKKCFHQELYNELVAIRAKENDFDLDSSFFPLYRR